MTGDRAPLAARAADARELVLSYLQSARRGEAADPTALQQAADLLYDPPEGEHSLIIARGGWGVEHPKRCSELGDPDRDCLIGADLKRWLRLEVEPPLEPGEYLVEYDAEQGKTRVVRRIGDPPDTV